MFSIQQVYAHVTIGKTQQGVPRNELDVLQVQYAVLDHSKLVDKEDSTEVQTGPEGRLCIKAVFANL